VDFAGPRSNSCSSARWTREQTSARWTREQRAVLAQASGKKEAGDRSVDGEESDKISEQRTRKKRRGGLAANLDFDSSLDANAALHSPERASSKSLSDSLRNRKPSRRRAWAARREQAAEADRS